MKKLIYILFGLLLLSCTKGSGNIYVEGKTYNPVSGAAIPNVKIELVRTNKPGAGDPFGGGGNAVVQEVYSDANGEFVIEHLGALHGNYYLLPTLSGDFEILGWESNNQITRGIEVKEETYDNVRIVP